MIPSTVRIFACTEPQDMRRSFDWLALIAEQRLGEDAKSGAIFLFVNKRANRLKALWWDGNGFCILYKRIHRAHFRLPRTTAGQCAARINAAELAEIIRGRNAVAKEKMNSIRAIDENVIVPMNLALARHQKNHRRGTVRTP